MRDEWDELEDEIYGGFLNPERGVDVTEHRLPHWHQRGALVGVTWRLADALPTGVAQTEIALEAISWRTLLRRSCGTESFFCGRCLETTRAEAR